MKFSVSAIEFQAFPFDHCTSLLKQLFHSRLWDIRWLQATQRRHLFGYLSPQIKYIARNNG